MNDLEEETTPIEDSPMPHQRKEEDPPHQSKIDQLMEKISGPIVGACFLGLAGWMIQVDRTQQRLLYIQEKQTETLAEVSKAAKDINQQLSDTYPALDSRVSFIEKTRFTQERGASVEARLIVLESEVAELKRSKKR